MYCIYWKLRSVYELLSFLLEINLVNLLLTCDIVYDTRSKSLSIFNILSFKTLCKLKRTQLH